MIVRKQISKRLYNMSKKKKAESKEINKYSKIQESLAGLIEVVGDKNKERLHIDVLNVQFSKYSQELSDLGFSMILSKDMMNRISNAHSQRNLEILAGTAMGLSLMLTTCKVF